MPRPRRMLFALIVRLSVLCSGIPVGYLSCPRVLTTKEAMSTDQPASPNQSPLDRHMGNVQLHHATLADAVRLMRETTAANIFLEPNHEDDSGAPEEVAFDGEFQDPTLGEFFGALRLSDPWLTFTNQDSVLLIRRSEDGANAARGYPVQDLLDDRELWLRFENAANGPGHYAPTAQNREDMLLNLVEQMVGVQNDWPRADDRTAPVRIVSGQLFVTQSPRGHEQVADLLEVLRRIADQPR